MAISNPFSKKAYAPPEPRSVPSFGGTPVERVQKNLYSQYKAGYEANPYVFRCVNLRADACAAVDPIIYDQKGDEIENAKHPLKKLIDRPNPRMSWSELVRDVQIYLGINGNAFLCPVKTTFSAIAELWPLPPDSVIAIASNDVTHPVKQWNVNIAGSI